MNAEIIVKKPNAMIVMLLRSGKLTPIERNLYNSILVSSIYQLKEYKLKHGGPPPHSHFYSAPASELLEPIERGSSNLGGRLKKYMTSLRTTMCDWQSPESKEGVIWQNLNPLTEAKFELRNGRLFALWDLPNELNKAIGGDGKEFPFTPLDLRYSAELTSYTAVALYEICIRYRNNYLKGGGGVCLTNKAHPDWWVEALTNHLPKKDKKTGELIRREWRKVKNEALNDALSEINRVTDLKVELDERKTGKAVTSVQFMIWPKADSVTKQVPNNHYDLIRRGLHLGISQSVIEEALSRNTVEKIDLALANTEGRAARLDLPPLKKAKDYFSKLIKVTPQIELISDVQDVEVKTESPSIGGIGPPEPKNENRARAREEFLLLSENVKKELGLLAITHFKSKDVASPRMLRQFEDGVWSGVLLAKMIEIFAVQKYGEQWATDDSAPS